MLDFWFTTERQSRFAHGIGRRYRLVLSLASVLTAVSLFGASRLHIDSDMVALLPRDSQSVVDLRQLTDKIGGTGDMQILISSPDPQRSLDYAQSILPAIRSLAWVEIAKVGNDTQFFDAHKLLYTELSDLQIIDERVKKRVKYETLRAQPLYIDFEDEPVPSLDFSDIEDKYRKQGPRSPYFRNESGSILLIVVQPKGIASDIAHAKRVQRSMWTFLEGTTPTEFHPEMRVEMGGAYRNRINEIDTIANDVRSSALVVGLTIVLLIALYFRHALAALLIMVPLAMSLSWTFALTFLLLGSLNLATVFLVVVLMGLGIDFGIHMLARFQRERATGAPLNTALALMLSKAGRASLTAALTTAACFLVLLNAEFRGFVEFGLIAGTGLLMSAIAYFVVLPALLSWTTDRRWMQPRLRSATLKVFDPKGFDRTRRGARFVLLLSGVVVVVAVVMGRHAAFEYDLRNLRANMPETRDFNRRVREVFPKARDPAAVLVRSEGHVPRVAAQLRQRRQDTSPHSPIDSVIFSQDLLPRDQDHKLEILGSLRRELDELFEILDDEELAEYASVRKDLDVERVDEVAELPPGIVRQFYGRPGTEGELVYVYQSGSLMDLRVAQEFSGLIDDLEVDGTRYRALSEPLLYVSMLQILSRDTPRALVLSVLALLLFLFLDFRSVGDLCLVLLPLGAGLAIMAGCMVLIPIRLNFLNVIVLPTMLGIGVDGGVHMLHNVRELGVKSMGRVVRETGSAVAVCSLSSLLGFAGMLVAAHPGLRSIGLLALVGLLGCLFGALVILPTLLLSLGREASRD